MAFPFRKLSLGSFQDGYNWDNVTSDVSLSLENSPLFLTIIKKIKKSLKKIKNSLKLYNKQWREEMEKKMQNMGGGNDLKVMTSQKNVVDRSRQIHHLNSKVQKVFLENIQEYKKKIPAEGSVSAKSTYYTKISV